MSNHSRDIKFRTWDPQLNQYTDDGCGQILMSPYNAQMYFEDGQEEGLRDVEGLILEQFTGLKDKNEKEIYEGDIVINEEGNLIGEVSFRPDYGWCRGWKYRYPKEGQRKDVFLTGSIARHKYTSKHGWIFKSYVQVIGNIHENPKLI